MKKYSITTTVNGKALVKQEHTFGIDGCTTSYGDFWGFETLTEAALWVDKELNNITLDTHKACLTYFKYGTTTWGSNHISIGLSKDQLSDVDPEATKSLLDKIAEYEKVSNE